MLLFDQLLEEENLTGGTLDLLKEIYHRHFENAEVGYVYNVSLSFILN